MKPSRALFSVALAVSALAFCTAAAPIQSSLFGRNLLVNGDAEAGAGAYDETVAFRVPGWTTHDNFTAVEYGAVGAFPMWDDPGPADRGRNFFSGGPSNAFSWAVQTVDVSAATGPIDAGMVAYALAGYIGGYGDQNDNVTVTAKFLGAGGGVLARASIGPVFALDRHNVTGLLERHALGGVPPGTRAIKVQIVSQRLGGSYNDGECDNLSLTLARR
jgi:hypothetical protein